MIDSVSPQNVKSFKLTRIGADLYCGGYRVAIIIEGDAPYSVFDMFRDAIDSGHIIIHDEIIPELKRNW